jgi:hypothetical protein
MPRLFFLSLPAAVLALAACAAGPGPEAFDEGPPGPPGAPRPALFISPHGQPFRSGPGEPYPVAAWFAAADRDRDGRVSRAEFRADAEAFFRTLDANNDGTVDGFEVAAYERSIPEMAPRLAGLAPGEGQDPNLGQRDGERRQLSAARPRGRGGPVREGASPYTFLDQPEPVLAADTDFDSKVSLAEAQAAADRRFTVLDSNGDGYLTLEELPKTAAQQAAERGQGRGAQRRGGRGR